jgi:F-type H+-transporting ATPase subunit delta
VPRGANARRYAQAVFELASQNDDVKEWSEGLERLSELVSQPDTAVYLESAQVPVPEKRVVFERALGVGSPLQVNLGLLLATRGRLREIPGIIREFARLENEHLGIAVAYVTTATPLSEAEAAATADRLTSITGKKIVVERSVDPRIIGGIIARVEDKLIDASISNQLQALRKQIAQ